jgi:integrase
MAAHKTGKDMVIPVNKALRRVIERMNWGEGYIFRSRSGGRRANFKDQPWSESWVTDKFKCYVRECGLAEEYHLHSLRHTFSTHLIAQGVSLDIVQKLLGHSSVRVTADNYDHSIALNFRSQADLVDFEGGSSSASP